jgi:hypothetical protein
VQRARRKKNKMDESKKEIQPLDYLQNIEELEITDGKLQELREKILERFDAMQIPLELSFQEIDEYKMQLGNYWNKYGHNYDVIPELSLIPHFLSAMQKYIAITYKEKLLLVKSLIDTLSTVDGVKVMKQQKKEIKEKTESVKKENEEVKQILDDINKPRKKRKKKVVEPEELNISSELDELEKGG